MRELNRSGKEVARCALIALLLATVPSAALAEEDAPGSKISGSLNLDFNTHFMSYGLDIWQRKSFDDILFNPSFSLSLELPAGFSVYGGTWWDVNDNADTNIGDYIQEIDVWAGVSYAIDIVSLSATYQEWYYAGEAERILDVGLGLDTLLSPSLTLHTRVDGNGAQDEGLVAVLGASHAFDLGALSLKPAASIAFLTEDYHVEDEGGFGYVSAGVGASVPLAFLGAAYGDWSLNGDVTYYYTDSENIDNRNDNIVTGKLGVSVAF